jgi:type IV secretory pathway VirB10-like protein
MQNATAQKDKVMSAPQTNLRTQERRHRGPIIGMVAVVTFALLLLFWLMMDMANEGTPADNNAPEIDGRTGEHVETTPDAGQTTVPGAPVDDPLIPEDDPPPVETPTPQPDLPDEPLPDSGANLP